MTWLKQSLSTALKNNLRTDYGTHTIGPISFYRFSVLPENNLFLDHEGLGGERREVQRREEDDDSSKKNLWKIFRFYLVL